MYRIITFVLDELSILCITASEIENEYSSLVIAAGDNCIILILFFIRKYIIEANH